MLSREVAPAEPPVRLRRTVGPVREYVFAYAAPPVEAIRPSWPRWLLMAESVELASRKPASARSAPRGDRSE